MGPVRGFKKRKKAEKNKSHEDQNASGSGSSEKEGPLDWWDEFSKRINGMFALMLLLYSYLFLFVLLYDVLLYTALLNSHVMLCVYVCYSV